MSPSNITKITKIGAVIMTTVASFILSPPALTSGENQGVNWKNFATFFAGIVSIALYDQFKAKTRRISSSYVLLGFLVFFMFIYEYFYQTYSKPCFGTRIITSQNLVKSDAVSRFSYWQQHSKGQDPVVNMLQSCKCDPKEMWDDTNLYFSYYGLVILYFLIIIMIILLIVQSTDLYIDKKP
jgi:hypothetical protein